MGDQKHNKHTLRTKPRNRISLPVKLGGYYAVKYATRGRYKVIRLLNMDRDSYDYQVFREAFDHVPSLEQVSSLKPKVGHANEYILGLLNTTDVILIGGNDLTDEALREYNAFLEEVLLIDRKGIEKTLFALQLLSREQPLQVIIERTSGTAAVASAPEEGGNRRRIGIDPYDYLDENAIGPEGVSNRLQWFLRHWCDTEPDFEDIANMLRSPQGKDYLPWLPQELWQAIMTEKLNPESMEKLTGIVFHDQEQVRDWVLYLLRLVPPRSS